MVENQQHHEEPSQSPPQVVQVVYQVVPPEEAPIPSSQLSALEGRTGFLIIILLAIWGFIWVLSEERTERDSYESSQAIYETQTESGIVLPQTQPVTQSKPQPPFSDY